MRFFKNRPLMITLAVALVLIILLMVLPAGKLGGQNNIAGNAAAGTQSVLSSIFRSVGGFFSNLFGGGDLAKENIALQEQVAALQSQMQSKSELEEENIRLKGLLDYIDESTENDYIACKVIWREPGLWFDTFTINAGYNKDVKKNDAVITPDGLVGRVIEVGGNYAKVMPIIDSTSKVSGIVERTRDNVTVVGARANSSQSGLCVLDHIDSNMELVPGDKIFTSNLGGMFPRGLEIGEILSIGTEENPQILVQPSVDFQHIEEVLVVKPKQVTEGGSQ